MKRRIRETATCATLTFERPATIRGVVKRLVALAMLAVLGFAVAGCGSKKHQVHSEVPQKATIALGGEIIGTITVTGQTATLPNVKTGTRIACKGLPGIRVTAPATGASVIARSRGTRELRLKRLPNGSIQVSCRAPH